MIFLTGSSQRFFKLQPVQIPRPSSRAWLLSTETFLRQLKKCKVPPADNVHIITIANSFYTRVRLRCLCWLAYWSILLAILRTCKKRALSFIWPGISLVKLHYPLFLTVGQSVSCVKFMRFKIINSVKRKTLFLLCNIGCIASSIKY